MSRHFGLCLKGIDEPTGDDFSHDDEDFFGDSFPIVDDFFSTDRRLR